MAGPGLYANIHAKRKRGEKMRKKGSKGAPTAKAFARAKKTAGKPLNYIAHESSVLLGNAVKGRKSNRYYIYKQYFMKSSSLY